MKRVLVLVVMIVLIGGAVFGQKRLVFPAAAYIQQNNIYSPDGSIPLTMPQSQFTDVWRSFGLGSTQFVTGSGSAFGFYNTTFIYLPIDAVRNGTDPADSQGATYFPDFRLGIDTISGGGVNFGKEKIGAVIGLGLHLDYAFIYNYPLDTVPNDRQFSFFTVGVGGGGNVYIMVNEKINIHVGTLWWYDFWQPRYSGSGSFELYKFQGWGFNVTAGVGFKMEGPGANKRGIM